MSINDTFKAYQNWLKNEGGYSKNTLRAYIRLTSSFLEFLAQNEIEDLRDVNKAIISMFFRPISAKKLSKSTISNKVSALYNFFQWLYLEDLVDENPVTKYKLSLSLGGRGARQKQRKPAVLYPSELDTLIGEMHASERKNSKRNLALVCFLIDTGLRTDEVIKVTLRDVEVLLSDNVLRVIGKGDKERVLRLELVYQDELLGYFIQRRCIQTQEEVFFLSQKSGALSPNAIYKIINTALTDAKIKKPQSGGHLLRHTAASLMLSKGKGLKEVQELLGHSSIATTERYLHLV